MRIAETKLERETLFVRWLPNANWLKFWTLTTELGSGIRLNQSPALFWCLLICVVLYGIILSLVVISRLPSAIPRLKGNCVCDVQCNSVSRIHLAFELHPHLSRAYEIYIALCLWYGTNKVGRNCAAPTRRTAYTHYVRIIYVSSSSRSTIYNATTSTTKNEQATTTK